MRPPGPGCRVHEKQPWVSGSVTWNLGPGGMEGPLVPLLSPQRTNNFGESKHLPPVSLPRPTPLSTGGRSDLSPPGTASYNWLREGAGQGT